MEWNKAPRIPVFSWVYMGVDFRTDAPAHSAKRECDGVPVIGRDFVFIQQDKQVIVAAGVCVAAGTRTIEPQRTAFGQDFCGHLFYSFYDFGLFHKSHCKNTNNN